MHSFGPVAPFYDELMESVPYRMWASYYLLLLSQQDIHPKSVLDVCCGTGTMCELLQDEGLEVEGFDLSADMIAKAREKAKHRFKPIRYEVADAAEVDMGRSYDAAFSFFDSLNYITDPEQLRRAVLRVGEHVNRGGSFVFDLNTAYAFEAELFDQQSTSQRAKVKYDWKGNWNPDTKIIEVDMKFWWNGQTYHETHIQRAHTDGEIRDMLEQAGFSQIRCYDSYTLNAPRAKSDRVHYTAIKE